MKYPVRNIGRSILSLIIIAGFLYYLYIHRDTLIGSIQASWYQVTALLFLILLSWTVNCAQVVLLLHMEGVRIGFWENMLIQTASLMCNYLPLRIGSIIRFRYFRKIHNLNYLKFGGIIGLRTSILISSAGFLGTIGTIGLAFSGRSFNVTLCTIFTCSFVLPVVLLISPIRNLFKRRILFTGHLSDLLSSFEKIRHHQTTAAGLVVFLLLQYLFLAARFYVSFNVMQIRASCWVLFILAPTVTVLSFLTLTPGNLGLREWIIGIVSIAAGNEFNDAIFAATIDRAVLVVTTFVFGTFGLYYVFSRFRKVREHTSDFAQTFNSTKC